MLEITNENGLKLRPEFKEAWVAALRSGAYVQATGYLHVIEEVPGAGGEGWCCLGVACDVLAKGGADIPRSERDIQPEGRIEMFDESGQMPSSAVRELMFVRPFAMTNGDFTSSVADLLASLATENDGGATFEEIVAWVEENL